MPNAGDITHDAPHKFLLIGGPGAGKTVQIRTLPGRTFVYAFDPNCVLSLRGASNIDYEEFLPDMLDLAVQPLAAKARSDRGKPREPLAYREWEQDFEQRVYDNAFADYDNIVIDSCTTLADIIMDRTQFLNGRLGKHPEQADWTTQMHTFINIMRVLAAQNKRILATAHAEARTNEVDGITEYQPLFTGRLKLRVPLLFTDVLRLESDVVRGKKRFNLYTVGSTRHQYVRCSLPNADPVTDVTIEDWEPEACASQGLGGLYNLAPSA